MKTSDERDLARSVLIGCVPRSKRPVHVTSFTVKANQLDDGYTHYEVITTLGNELIASTFSQSMATKLAAALNYRVQLFVDATLDAAVAQVSTPESK